MEIHAADKCWFGHVEKRHSDVIGKRMSRDQKRSLEENQRMLGNLVKEEISVVDVIEGDAEESRGAGRGRGFLERAAERQRKPIPNTGFISC